MTYAASFADRAARLAVLVFALSPLTQAMADTAATAPAAPAAPAPVATAPAAPAVVLPIGTEVALELAEPLDTDLRHPGDVVKLRVASDVMLDGKVAVPAGTPASGEIIHISQRGNGGRAGELVMTPRFIETAGGKIPLHAAFSASGADGGGKAAWGVGVGTALTGGLGGALIGALSPSPDSLVVPAGAHLTAHVVGGDPLPTTTPTSTFVRVPEASSPVIGTPEAGKGQVVVFRPRKFAGAGAGYVLSENDTEIGGVDNGTYLVFSVEPGRHRYQAGKKKDTVTFEVAPGEVYYLMGSMVPTGLSPVANVMPATAEAFAAAKAELHPGQIPADWQ